MFSNVLSLISSCLWKGNTFVDFKNCVRLQPEAPNIYKPGITHSHRCGSDSKIWFKEMARTSSRWIVNKKNIVFNSVKDFGSKRCPLCPLRLWVSSVFRKEFYFSSLLKPNLNSCQVSNNIRGISWGCDCVSFASGNLQQHWIRLHYFGMHPLFPLSSWIH